MGDQFGEGQAWGNLGGALRATGHPEQARQAWRRALALFGDLGADHEAGIVRTLLAELDKQHP